MIWEKKPDLVSTYTGQIVRLKFRNHLAVEQVFTGCWRIQAPQHMHTRGDLPDPDGPMIAINLPRWMSRSTSRKACTTWDPTEKSRHNPWVWMTAGCMAGPLTQEPSNDRPTMTCVP
ncbi:MAG: hypothetical protein Ct9H300mP16_14500 [Pseudomonadota bacterium]|nr:MAG: hypothetical protein Ct9H300mP16_14500 [Pseudomonadota bacterium]